MDRTFCAVVAGGRFSWSVAFAARGKGRTRLRPERACNEKSKMENCNFEMMRNVHHEGLAGHEGKNDFSFPWSPWECRPDRFPHLTWLTLLDGSLYAFPRGAWERGMVKVERGCDRQGRRARARKVYCGNHGRGSGLTSRCISAWAWHGNAAIVR